MKFHYLRLAFLCCLGIGLNHSILPGQATINISNPSVTEGDAGITNVTFSVTCNPCASVNAIIDWRINDGSATLADSDYNDASGRIDDIGNGSAVETVNITVQVNGDTKVEADETIELELYNASVGAPSLLFQNNDRTGTATIINDDENQETDPQESDGCTIWDILLWILILLLFLLCIKFFRGRRTSSP